MNTPSPFTTACELLDELVASTTNFPTIQHTCLLYTSRCV